MDTLKKSETWLKKLADGDLDDNPKFQKFQDLIKAHDESMKAHKWLSAHDEIESAFSLFAELTNSIMVKAKQRMDSRDSDQKSVNELLDSHRNSLKQILRAAQTIGENAEGLLDNLERPSKR